MARNYDTFATESEFVLSRDHVRYHDIFDLSSVEDSRDMLHSHTCA